MPSASLNTTSSPAALPDDMAMLRAPSRQLQELRAWIVYVSCALVLALAVIVLPGWSRQSPLLVAIGLGRATTKFNTAVCFGAFALGALLTVRGHPRAALCSSIVILVIATGTLIEQV